jgi:hypothetical protein
MDVPYDVIWPEEFDKAWGKFSYELESTEDSDEIDDRIAAAIQRLEDDGPRILDVYKPGSSKFSVPIDEKYLLIVRWRTDHDGEGRFLRHHLDLVGIQRLPLKKKIKEKA